MAAPLLARGGDSAASLARQWLANNGGLTDVEDSVHAAAAAAIVAELFQHVAEAARVKRDAEEATSSTEQRAEAEAAERLRATIDMPGFESFSGEPLEPRLNAAVVALEPNASSPVLFTLHLARRAGDGTRAALSVHAGDVPRTIATSWCERHGGRRAEPDGPGPLARVRGSSTGGRLETSLPARKARTT